MKEPHREQVDVRLDADFFETAHRVGTLFHASAHGRETFSFAYDREWLKLPDAFAIDPALSLHDGESYPANGTGVFRIFLDSAPDRWGRQLLERRELLRAREENRRARSLREWDYLLGVHDSCRLGALRYQSKAAGAFLDDDDRLAAPPITSLRELEAASLALETPGAADRPEFSRWLLALIAPGSSLGGARPKANFTDPDGQLWIAKFPSREDRRDVGAWEMVVHELAIAAGIEVPPAKLLALAGRHRTFATKRFDRMAGRRRFFVSAMTLLGRSDGEGASYLELASFIKERAEPQRGKIDLRQLWTRMAFYILISNTDDHLRNHGFILGDGGWRLAPAYDINPSIERTSHALAIDERDPTPDVRSLLATAHFYDLSNKEAEEILAGVTKVVAGWSDVARRLRLPGEEIEMMASAFRI